MSHRLLLAGLLTTCIAVHMSAAQGGPKPSVTAYNSIQEAIDANPGRMLWVPAADYKIADKLRIRKDGSGLFGPGRIIQTNPKAPIIEIENAAGVRIQDLRLTRPEGDQETEVEGVLAIGCTDLSLVDLEVCENRTRAAAISLRNCVGGRIRGCLVRNYMRITVDDPNNIISEFGYTHAHWIWGDERSPFKFDSRQKPHNPPLTDVIVQGNIVYDTGRDGMVVDGKATTAGPRYKYAVILASEAKGIRFSNNLLHPGTAGVANVELKP